MKPPVIKLPEIDQTEMLQCMACGDYHLAEECEIVVIRVIKGKKCKLKKTEPVFSAPTLEVTKEVVEPSVEKIIPKKRNIVPPGFAGVFIPPEDPRYDREGAKEVRKL